MYTSTSKFKKTPHIFLLPLLILLIILTAYAEITDVEQDPEFIIDVVDNHFLCNGYDIVLAEMDTPIAIGVIDGNVLIEINTQTSVQNLSLGKGSISLTENAVSFVTILKQAIPQGIQHDEYGNCSVCGRSLWIGHHQKYECGHYGCLVLLDHVNFCSSCEQYMCNGIDHTPCEHCKVRMCIHENIKCEYMRNPAPTAFSTKTPDGKVQSYQISDDYTSVDGTVNRTQQWSPGLEYERKNATPAPNPNPTGLF